MRITCGECGGSGTAEYIAGYPRFCDACRGDGTLEVPLFWGIYINVREWWRKR